MHLEPVPSDEIIAEVSQDLLGERSLFGGQSLEPGIGPGPVQHTYGRGSGERRTYVFLERFQKRLVAGASPRLLSRNFVYKVLYGVVKERFTPDDGRR